MAGLSGLSINIGEMIMNIYRANNGFHVRGMRIFEKEILVVTDKRILVICADISNGEYSDSIPYKATDQKKIRDNSTEIVIKEFSNE